MSLLERTTFHMNELHNELHNEHVQFPLHLPHMQTSLPACLHCALAHTHIYALLHSAMREQLSQYLVGPARRHIGTAWKHWNSGIDNWIPIAATQSFMLCMHSCITILKKHISRRKCVAFVMLATNVHVVC